MRNLLSGIFGICFGLAVLCGGGAASSQGGMYRIGTYAGMICGGVFFLAGVPYLILGIMELANSGASREPRRFRRRRKPASPDAPKAASSSRELLAKADATKAILGILGERDEWFEPTRLKGIVEKLFVMFQEGWEHNDFQPLGKYVVHSCLDKYLARYDNDAKRLRMAKLDDHELKRVLLVHVAAAGEPETHTFTAYLEASGPDKFKEYWTFTRTAKRWKLGHMQAAGASTAVAQLNEVPEDVLTALESETGNDDLLAYIARG
jgi:predicted lipid-binding transport protein (Tim44 family)